MLLADETCAWLLVRDIELDAYHEAAAADINDMRALTLQLTQALHEILDHYVVIIYKALALNYVYNSYRSGAC